MLSELDLGDGARREVRCILILHSLFTLEPAQQPPLLARRPPSMLPVVSPSSSSLTHVPLEYKGALNEESYPRIHLTPALGIQFDKTVNLKKILELPQEKQDAVLHDLAILVSQNGVVFFQGQHDIVPEDIGRLALRLGELAGKPEDSTLHIHPTQELSDTGLPLGKIDSNPDKEGRQISFADKGFTSKGWHTDVAFENKPSLFTILQMTTLPKTGGDTLWQSNYHTYDALSATYAKMLEGLTASQDAERFREQSRVNGYKLRTAPRGSPDNVGAHLKASHPVVRTNQVTGWKSIYVNPTFTRRINELSIDESRSVLDYLFRVQHESHEAHVKYRWAKQDLAIWSNSVVNHLATFDFSEHRAGDRAVVVGETPYFDAESISRKQWLKASEGY